MKRDKSEMSTLEGTSQKEKSLWIFFCSCFSISAFTFGGGYVMVPLQKRRFCDELGWMEEEEILNLVAIAQSAPGPVAINASTLIGYHLFGLKGAFSAILSTILPPFLILSLISQFYLAFSQNLFIRAVLKAMQASVAALIFHTVFDMGESIVRQKNKLQIFLLFVCLALTLFTNLHVALILLLAGAASYLSGIRRTA